MFLDGSHNFDIDGLAVVLAEKLLRPGGWLLLDDLDWTYEQNPWVAPELSPDGTRARSARSRTSSGLPRRSVRCSS